MDFKTTNHRPTDLDRFARTTEIGTPSRDAVPSREHPNRQRPRRARRWGQLRSLPRLPLALCIASALYFLHGLIGVFADFGATAADTVALEARTAAVHDRARIAHQYRAAVLRRELADLSRVIGPRRPVVSVAIDGEHNVTAVVSDHGTPRLFYADSAHSVAVPWMPRSRMRSKPFQPIDVDASAPGRMLLTIARQTGLRSDALSSVTLSADRARPGARRWVVRSAYGSGQTFAGDPHGRHVRRLTDRQSAEALDR